MRIAFRKDQSGVRGTEDASVRKGTLDQRHFLSREAGRLEIVLRTIQNERIDRMNGIFEEFDRCVRYDRTVVFACCNKHRQHVSLQLEKFALDLLGKQMNLIRSIGWERLILVRVRVRHYVDPLGSRRKPTIGFMPVRHYPERRYAYRRREQEQPPHPVVVQ